MAARGTHAGRTRFGVIFIRESANQLNTKVVQFRTPLTLTEKKMILKIEHFGYPFVSNENAALLASGMFHHYVWLKIQ